MYYTLKMPPTNIDEITAQLQRIEDDGGTGELTLGRGTALPVSNLQKVFFPDAKLTKGDLMRYYVWASPYLLPLMRDRALALKRFPDGAGGPSFFQQKAPHDPPTSVRVETIASESGEVQERLVGGTLATLLYCVQLGTIEVNPWNTKIQSLEFPNYTVIDLDPAPKVPFEGIVEVATWIREALESYGLHAAVKTSGSRGIHIALPLPPKTTEDVATVVAARVASAVVQQHPRSTTIERAIKARGTNKVYLDYGQNARGKTVASAYSVRAKVDAMVSTPLHWKELKPSLDPHRLTIRTVPARVEKLGDLWGELMRTPNPRAALKGV